MRLPALLLLAASVAAGERKFEDLDEAKEAVLKARAEALARLEKEALPIPEVFLEADEKRHDAMRAWFAERWDDAHAAFESAWTLYPQSVERAQQEKAAAADKGTTAAPRLGSSAPGKAVDAALAWLSRHQDALGRWDCAGFMKHDPADDRCDGAGDKAYDVGVTALATLAFLEHGASPRRLDIHRALQWLRAQQDENGVFGPQESHHYIYNHALVTLALAKALSLTKDPRYEPSLKRGLDYILAARNAATGWRYEPGDGETDTSVTCWCYRALVAGTEAGIALDLADAGRGARAALAAVTLEDGRIGYQWSPVGQVARPERKDRFPPDRSRAMTAAGTVLRLLLDGDKADRKRLQLSLDQCLSRPPTWNPDDGSIDMYYWYYGTLACTADKTRAGKWRTSLHKAVLQHQHPAGAGARTGSWDPIDVWGAEGGRVYSTAILALALLHAG